MARSVTPLLPTPSESASARNIERGTGLRHRASWLAWIDWAALVLAMAAVVIAGAFAFQWAGYAPCELCLEERKPYYGGMAVAVATLIAGRRRPRTLGRAGYGALALIFLFSAGFGAYHAGVEWGWWAGPTECSGAMTRATTSADFLQQLDHIKVVRCDAVAVRVLGLSLAGWNVIASFLIAATAIAGFMSMGRRQAGAS